MKKLAFILLALQWSIGFSQAKKTKKVEILKITKKDSIDKKDALSTYSDLLKGAQTKKGLFTIHKVKEKIYFEIPNEVLSKDLLLVNKISSVPAQINNAGVNKGINYENKLIRLYKDTKNKKI